jgi:hypothetical protein
VSRWAENIKLDVQCTAHGELRNAFETLAGKPEWKRPLGRHNIQTDLREARWDGVDWICLAQDSGRWLVVVNREMNLFVP